jgi:hypothetical protein
MTLIYLPAAAGQIWTFYKASTLAVGLIPCIIGIHLITLGYLRLRQESVEAAQQGSVP